MSDIEFLQEVSKKIINEIPIVSKRQFYDMVEAGDIILASPSKKFLKVRKLPILSKLISGIQGLKTSSSKMIAYDKKIIGYGILYNSRDFAIRKLTTWLNDRESAILLRVNNATDQQKKRAVDFMLTQTNADYDKSDLFKSAWRKTLSKFKHIFLSFSKDDSNNTKINDAIDYVKESYICSNIISIAFYKSGYTHKFNNQEPTDVWPKDFLLDNEISKIARFGL